MIKINVHYKYIQNVDYIKLSLSTKDNFIKVYGHSRGGVVCFSVVTSTSLKLQGVHNQ